MSRLPGQNQKIKLVAAISLSAFSMIAVVVSTIAWFAAARRKGNDNGMSILTPDKRFKSMSIHNVVNADYRTAIYQFDYNPVATAVYNETTGNVDYSENFTIEMETYNDLEQNHPVLMLVELVETVTATADEPLTVYASSTSTEYFGLPDEDGSPKNEILQEGNPLSSVVNFFSKAMRNTDPLLNSFGSYTDTDAGVTYSTYNFPMAEFKTNYDGFTRESFVQFNDETMEYQDFIQNKNLISLTSGSYEYIAIIVDYYHAAVEYVYSTFLSEEALEDTIYFTCDWSMVI